MTPTIKFNAKAFHRRFSLSLFHRRFSLPLFTAAFHCRVSPPLFTAAFHYSSEAHYGLALQSHCCSQSVGREAGHGFREIISVFVL
jgi:hypothetical protein